MTMLEKLQMEHPEFIGQQFPGGVAICPEDVGYEDISDTCIGCGFDTASKEYADICRRCWERELQG